MTITWLGQAGLLFETGGKTILVDPYFSDSCKELDPSLYRRVPVENRFLNLHPDYILCTHAHRDHYDEETLKHFLTPDTSVTCLVAPSVFPLIRKFGKNHNYVSLPRFSMWTEDTIRFTTTLAVHSDPDAVGFIIEAEEKKYYVTGDTVYNTEIFKSLPKDLYAVFLPVNGVGNNMNFRDARAFAEQCGAQYVVPLHLGMLDDRNVSEFECQNAVIPKIYNNIKFECEGEL